MNEEKQVNEDFKLAYEFYINGLNRVQACKELINLGFGNLRQVEPITRVVYNMKFSLHN